MGFKRDGTIVAKKMNMLIDAGGYTGSCRGITVVASSRADNLYRLPNIKTSARLVYTNNIPRGAVRGYGTQLMIFPLESTIDMAAEKLGIDPAEIRLKNIAKKGDIGPHGFIFNSCGLNEAIQLTTDKSGWQQKRKEKAKDYGIGMANAIHSAGALVMELKRVCSGSGAIIRVDEHGQVLVISGETDIGQGSTTVFAQIAAEEMGVNIEDVRILPADTDVSLFALGTFGDRLTVLGGHAVLKGAADAKRQILNHSAKILKVNADELELKNSGFYIKGSSEPIATLQELASQIINNRSGVPIIGQGNYVAPSYVVPQSEKNNYYGNYSLAYAFINQVAEVAVDPDTGKVNVLDIWIGQDVGKAINPKMCEGQIEGAAMMGIGYALGEGYIVDKGKILNPNFTDYRMPTSQSIPKIHISLVETIDPNTPYGAKGAGEASMNPVAATIANAVYNATGVRIKDLPFTPEKMLKALKEKNRRQEESTNNK
jgi:CO/xanthine dehydrogenase Mo-binding subunit